MRFRWATASVLSLSFCLPHVVAQNPAAPPPPLVPPAAPAPAPVAPAPSSGAPFNPWAETWSALKDGRVYGDVEGLLWFIKKANTPPLVTTGNVNDATPGAIGQPGTGLAVGGDLELHLHGGAQFTLGFWGDQDQSWGGEAIYWFLAQRTSSFGLAGNGNPGSAAISIPFFNPNTGLEDAFPVVVPGVQQGGVTVTYTDKFQGGDLNFLWAAGSDSGYRFGLIAGVKGVSLDESLAMQSNTEALPLSAGIVDSHSERFHTINEFVGAQLGGEMAFRDGPWFLRLRGTCAVGGSRESVDISGLAFHTDPVVGTVFGPGGVFAQTTNIGSHERAAFVVIPQVGANLEYWWTNWLCTRIGYQFIYVSNVVRPGDQIDRTVSIQPIPAGPIIGVARPLFAFKESDFWAQGINFGLEIKF